MKQISLIIALAAGLTLGCVSQDTATQVLQGAGYTDIELGGYAALACSSDDTFQRSFSATGPSGKRVKGAVCCGWLKDCTIRTH